MTPIRKFSQPKKGLALRRRRSPRSWSRVAMSACSWLESFQECLARSRLVDQAELRRSLTAANTCTPYGGDW